MTMSSPAARGRSSPWPSAGARRWRGPPLPTAGRGRRAGELPLVARYLPLTLCSASLFSQRRWEPWGHARQDRVCPLRYPTDRGSVASPTVTACTAQRRRTPSTPKKAILYIRHRCVFTYLNKAQEKTGSHHSSARGTCFACELSPLRLFNSLPSLRATAMAGAESGQQQHHCPCGICMEPMAPHAAHRGGAACAHAFCRACLSGHVRAKVETGAGAVVRCPDPSCAGALDPELCRAALPPDVFERWCAALCESLFPAARRTYCPFPDCSEMMVADGDGNGGAEGCVTQSACQVECQVCKRLFCARCRVAPWHAGVACDEYQRLAEGDRGREDMMLYEMAEARRWKRCPNCQFFVDKIDGCALIRCRCGFEFCYWCGTTWGTAHSKCRGG